MLIEMIRQSAFGGPASAVTVFVLFLVAAGVTNFVFRLIIRQWRRGTTRTLGIEVLETLRGPAVLFLALSGMFVALLILTSLEGEIYALLAVWEEWILRAWLVVIIVEVAYVIYRVLDTLLS